MRAHLFVSSCDGGLYDTRDANWISRPLREVFNCHFPRIDTMAQVKACLRAGRFTDLGGYPLYFVAADGEAISFKAARDNLREIAGAFQTGAKDWRIVACEINYEDQDLTCAHTGKPIASAYGESDQ